METLMSTAMSFFVGVVFAALPIVIFKSNSLRLVAAVVMTGFLALMLNLSLGHMLSFGHWTGYVFVAAGILVTIFVADYIRNRKQ
jgi:hypothetical protein